MEKISLIELDESFLPKMAELYKEAFAGEPWNDDWSDSKQLNEYIKDISKAYNALNYGLMIDGELAGMSVGRINHWWEGTNYNIDELCIAPKYQGQGIGSKFLELIEQRVREKGLAGIFLQTDNDKPSYHFYHKNGFNDLDMHISLYKSVRRNEEAKVSDAESESDGITLDTMVSYNNETFYPLRKMLNTNKKLIEYLSQLDFSEIVLKKAEAYGIQSASNIESSLFSEKEKDILRLLYEKPEIKRKSL